MIKTLTTIVLAVFCMQTIRAQKHANISGNWQIKTYYSTLPAAAEDKQFEKKCSDMLVLNINKKGKMKFIFSDNKDSIVFSGRIKFRKNKIVQIKHNIRESIYLGELEKCITAELREDMRRIFYRAFACAVESDHLMFYYSTPSDLRHKKAMVLVRQNGSKTN